MQLQHVPAMVANATKGIGMADRYQGVFFTLDSNPDLARAVFNFRTRLFVDHLGWSLSMENGIERDQFDTANAIYCALLYRETVVGCFRAIPCNQPYLAKDVFSHLATTAKYPGSPRALEISRFGVAVEHPPAGIRLYSLMIRLALTRNVISLVAIVELSHERLLNMIGLKTVRYGGIHIVGFTSDGSWILAVAGEIPVSHEIQPRLQKILERTKQMEIIDETEVYRHSRLSA
jgi:acyl homoserine lactone synthase